MMSNMIRKIAEKNGVKEEIVVEAIHEALKESMNSQTETSRNFWNLLAPDGNSPSPEAAAAMLTFMVLAH